MAKILLVEPFYTGSHKQWVDDLIQHSKHRIDVLTLEGRFWKWRMHGAAISLALQVSDTYDAFICTDMLDLSLFKSLLSSENANKPFVLYFHENQLTHPWSAKVKEWDRNYAWINYTSCLTADHICFNSNYNLKSFNKALKPFLKAFPDHNNLETLEPILKKSRHLPLGMNLNEMDRLDDFGSSNPIPIILWNHRWEHDKNPELFFDSLFQLSNEGLAFELMVLGESYKKQPAIFAEAKEKLKEHIIEWSFKEERKQYLSSLQKADILPVTSNHEFFGIAVLEAIYLRTTPLLPNRLSYPEHFPNFDIFYDSDLSFYQKLKTLIVEKPSFDPYLRKAITQYDWNQVILQYDDLFSEICS